MILGLWAYMVLVLPGIDFRQVGRHNIDVGTVNIMKRRILTLTLLAAALLGGASHLRAGGNGRDPNLVPVSYYGDNDLVDYNQAGQIMKNLSKSTVALFPAKALPFDEGTGVYKLTNVSLKNKYNLSADQPFAGQTVGAYCSGALVGEDLVLTAGHCFKPHSHGLDCAKVKLVFDYAVTRAGETPSSFPADNVYSCKKIISQKAQDDRDNFTCKDGTCTNSPIIGDGVDYALVQLDRKVKGRPALAINRTKVAKDTAVGVIGYPSGMPVKIQEKGAAVRSLTAKGYFVTNLDTFAGNSGSPVFNMKTYKIEGVLVRGGVDFVYDSSGTRVEDPRDPEDYGPGQANVYPQDGGRGEDVTFITEMQELIPQSEMEVYLNTRPAQTSRPQNSAKPVPAIYYPGQNGAQVQPAVYTVPEPSAPQPIMI